MSHRGVRILLCLALFVECAWWIQGLLGLKAVFDIAGQTLDSVHGRGLLYCAAFGFTLLLVLNIHLFMRCFGEFAQLRRLTLITFIAISAIGLILIDFPAQSVFELSPYASTGALSSLMAENSGNAEFPVMHFAGHVLQISLLNYLLLIPLYRIRHVEDAIVSNS